MSRKLDAAIAEALGYEVQWRYAFIDFHTGVCCIISEKEASQFHFNEKHPVIIRGKKEDGALLCDIVPRFSTDGNAMLELIDEIRQRGWLLNGASCGFDLSDELWFYTAFQKLSLTKIEGKRVYGNSRTLSKSVALAAYKALTGREWDETNQ